jgi:N-acetylglucosamine kinase-like BadF-type ATPase
LDGVSTEPKPLDDEPKDEQEAEAIRQKYKRLSLALDEAANKGDHVTISLTPKSALGLTWLLSYTLHYPDVREEPRRLETIATIWERINRWLEERPELAEAAVDQRLWQSMYADRFKTVSKTSP